MNLKFKRLKSSLKSVAQFGNKLKSVYSTWMVGAVSQSIRISGRKVKRQPRKIKI